MPFGRQGVKKIKCGCRLLRAAGRLERQWPHNQQGLWPARSRESARDYGRQPYLREPV